MRAIVVEGEANLVQPLLGHRLAQRGLVLGVEEQEAPSARSDQLSSDCAGFAADFVPAIDVVARHPLASLALVLPVLVHQLAETPGVAGLQSRLGLQSDP